MFLLCSEYLNLCSFLKTSIENNSNFNKKLSYFLLQTHLNNLSRNHLNNSHSLVFNILFIHFIIS